MANTFPEQKKVGSEEEVPHRVPLRRAAHRQPPAVHEGMCVSVCVCVNGGEPVGTFAVFPGKNELKWTNV